ncbi:MAG: hypothetical protein WDZ85_00415 [Candidatus Paceibacterota bacterium]
MDKKDNTSNKKLKVISVVPIDRGIFKDRLSYFSTVSAEIGALLTVPVRKREVPALVIGTTNVAAVKTEIKAQDFNLKKIDGSKARRFFSPNFIAAATLTADFFATTVGQTIKAVVPKTVLTDPSAFAGQVGRRFDKKINPAETETKSDVYIIQEPDAERLAYYKSLIRESFARNASVFFCLPTIPDIERSFPFLAKGIEKYAIILHGRLSKKAMAEAWRKATGLKHPVLIIATPLFLSLPRSDLKTLILDRENSSAYKLTTRPYIDTRFFAETLARKNKLRLILGDAVLRTETVFRQGKKELIAASPLKFRSFSEAKQKLAERTEQNKDLARGAATLGQDLKDLIGRTIAHNERLFIFTVRRGSVGITLCNDCGLIVSCEHCQAPLTIHQGLDRKYAFICHKCGQTYKIKDTCANCGSWRLSLLDGGIDKLAQEIETAFPDINLFKIDSDSASTGKKAKIIADKFTAGTGQVLLGTEMALHYIFEPIENTAVASIDALFGIPDFRVSEKIFGLLIRVRSLASKRFLIQTRNPEEKVFTYVLKGNLLDFYRDEIEERKTLGYPPFSTLIKISRTGRLDTVRADINDLAGELKDYEPRIYPGRREEANDKVTINLLIKLPPENWPDPKLLTRLRTLPPTFIIAIDPKEIL